MKITRTSPILFAAVIALGGCQTLSTGKTSDTPVVDSQEVRMNAAKEKATMDAALGDSEASNLVAMENQYKRNSDNGSYALAYAQGLRQAGYLNRAQALLKPFADKDDALAGTKTEMSMISLGLGDYNDAEKYAQEAIIQSPKDYYAYQNLGIALDAKEMHPEAERAFRKGLEYWEGDPTTIMNNLALNMATQGFIDEAVEILEKAKTISPDRIEIERNLRIIRTLNER